jgi:outer membrane protein assembly factor BamA
VGGKSGSKLELFPGYSIGDVGRTFPVRGFASGTLAGLRAASGSLEYRAPIAMPSHGLGMFPLFFDRVSLSLFADGGAAWCPDRYSALPVCEGIPTTLQGEWIASAGVELNLDAALQYDVPYRLRLGLANILKKPDGLTANGSEFYFTLGFPF